MQSTKLTFRTSKLLTYPWPFDLVDELVFLYHSFLPEGLSRMNKTRNQTSCKHVWNNYNFSWKKRHCLAHLIFEILTSITEDDVSLHWTINITGAHNSERPLAGCMMRLWRRQSRRRWRSRDEFICTGHVVRQCRVISLCITSFGIYLMASCVCIKMQIRMGWLQTISKS